MCVQLLEHLTYMESACNIGLQVQAPPLVYDRWLTCWWLHSRLLKAALWLGEAGASWLKRHALPYLQLPLRWK